MSFEVSGLICAFVNIIFVQIFYFIKINKFIKKFTVFIRIGGR